MLIDDLWGLPNCYLKLRRNYTYLPGTRLHPRDMVTHSDISTAARASAASPASAPLSTATKSPAPGYCSGLSVMWSQRPAAPSVGLSLSWMRVGCCRRFLARVWAKCWRYEWVSASLNDRWGRQEFFAWSWCCFWHVWLLPWGLQRFSPLTSSYYCRRREHFRQLLS